VLLGLENKYTFEDEIIDGVELVNEISSECLQYFHEKNQCKIDNSAFEYSMTLANPDCMKYLLEIGYKLSETIRYFLYDCDLQTYLCEWSSDQCCSEYLKYMTNTQIPFDKDVYMKYAIEHKRKHTIDYLSTR